MAGRSKAAAELVALLQETARHAVTVMDAAQTQPLPRQRTGSTAGPASTPAQASTAAPASTPAPAGAPGSVSTPAPASDPATAGPGATVDHAAPVQRRTAPAAQPLRSVPVQGSPVGAAPNRPADGAVTRSVLSVSIQDMPYLLDHCFFVQPDDWPDPEDRWPVVPATTVVQHMMDAAVQAAPGMRAVGVRDAKFNRWLIAAPPQKVDITVKPAGPGLLSVIFGGYAKATVEMAADYPADSPEVWVHDPSTEFPPTISAEEMYTERLMFHGPQFQGVTAVHALGDMHVRGVVTAPVPPGALLDNALQLIGNWLITTQPFRTVALPVGLGHVRFFGPPPTPGTAFECVARVRMIDDAQLVAGTQLIANGRVWAQIDDAVDRRFDSHPTARPAERFPERYPMSAYQPEGWTMAFDAWTDLVTRGMAARSILGGVAATEYERMPAAKRKQWMLGRIAAKDAVRFRQWEAGHTDVYPIELTVVNEPSGRPRVVLRPDRNLVECDVSLAHTAEIGVAIAHPLSAGSAVGIDVVELAPRDDTTVRYALSADEVALLDSLGDRDLWFTRFWAAKEAVGKAQGTGLDGKPRRFTVRAADSAGLTVAVGDRTYRVGFREVDNPPELPPRRYVVAWTWGPSAESTHR